MVAVLYDFLIQYTWKFFTTNMMDNRLKNVALALVILQLVAEGAKGQLSLNISNYMKIRMLQKQNGVTNVTPIYEKV